MREKIPITCLGVVAGAISALSFFVTFSFHGYSEQADPLSFICQFVPGAAFGLAVAIIYLWYTEDNISEKFLKALATVVAGLVCYQIAYFITYLIFLINVVPQVGFGVEDAELSSAPIGASIGAFIATLIFLCCLHALTKKFKGVIFKLSLYGALLGGFLIDAIWSYIFIINVADHQVALGHYIFFIGWQATMLLLFSAPLCRVSGDQKGTSTP